MPGTVACIRSLCQVARETRGLIPLGATCSGDLGLSDSLPGPFGMPPFGKVSERLVGDPSERGVEAEPARGRSMFQFQTFPFRGSADVPRLQVSSWRSGS